MKRRVSARVASGSLIAAMSIVWVHANCSDYIPKGGLGTCVMNLQKSSFSPGPPPPHPVTSTVTLAPGGGVHVVNERIDSDGKLIRQISDAKFDGKYVERQGAAQPTMRAFLPVDDYSFRVVTQVNGKPTTTSLVVMSKDGRTKTETTTGIDTDGRPLKNVSIWDCHP